jgi:hypothetical protein
VDDAAWGALTLSLTLLGGIYTWFAFRSRGWVAGLRGAGLTILPAALWLTDTLQLLGDLGGAIGDWVLDFAFSPAAWLGIVLALVSVTCFVTAGFLAERGVGAREPAEGADKPTPKELGRGKRAKKEPVLSDVDPEMAEIEALLRKRGIT